MHAHFRHLIEGFCTLCGLDDSVRVMNGGAIIINEVTFWLTHGEKDRSDLVLIHCDFGEVTRGRHNAAYRVLLEANLHFYTGSGPAFALSRDTGRVVVADQFALHDRCKADELYDALVRLAARAAAWRSDHFIDKNAPRAVHFPARRRPDFNR